MQTTLNKVCYLVQLQFTLFLSLYSSIQKFNVERNFQGENKNVILLE